ncbi:MAG: hypothetical protein NTU58_01400 [Candidatus Nealsonbacteria bacterium]|nr:hypothetical protein [Candidatus Nealsonbacteria bacterium]
MEDQYVEGKEIIVGFSGLLEKVVLKGGPSVVKQYVRLAEKAAEMLNVPLKDLTGNSKIGIASLERDAYPVFTMRDRVRFKGKSFSEVKERLEKMMKYMSSSDPVVLMGDYLNAEATFKNEKELANVQEAALELKEKYSLATSYLASFYDATDLLEDTYRTGRIDPKEGFVKVTTIHFWLPPFKRGFLKEIIVEWSVSLHCKVNRKKIETPFYLPCNEPKRLIF